MWPIILNLLRSNAVYLTLPFAGIVGFIGYNLESLISDKYTPYNESIQEHRIERLVDEVVLENADKVEKLTNTGGVLERNLSPSLQKKTEKP